MFGLLLAVCCWSRLDALASFSRVSSVLCFGVTWSVHAPSGTSAAWRHRESSLLCSRWIRCSMILRLWHGLRLLSMVGSEVSVQRTGARWRAQLRGVSEMFKPCSRESERQKRRAGRARRSRVVLNSPTWPCLRAACRIRLSVWGGAPPMSRLAGVDQKFCDISCTFGIDNLTDLYTCIIMQGAQI